MAARLPTLVAAGLIAAVAACSSRADDVVTATTTSTATTVATTEPPTSTTSTTEATTTSTTVPPLRWPTVPEGPAKAVVTENGVVVAVLADAGDGSFRVRSPCGNEVTVAGTPVAGANVVLDPGHGGDEPGAVGPAGTTEKAVNLAIAREAQRLLEALGASVLLTRTADYRITLASRAAIATALQPQLFISIHHNASPDGPRQGPGAETYAQIASPSSKRASGLLYEELVGAFEPYEISWVADRDAGAKYRPRAGGGDYYGILRRTAGVPAVLSEAAFISNAPEEDLLAEPAFQAVEAEAIASAVVRYITTEDPGSGFVEPYPRTEPAGPGGGPSRCVDPPLG